MGRYLFGENSYDPSHPQWQRILQKAKNAKLRPICLCKPNDGRLELYISKITDSLILKRMPFTATLHASYCDHYDPPPELSGLGQVNGSAIREESKDDITTLSLDFPMTKGRSRAPVQASDVEHESVRSDGTKLTMRAVLHYLYDEAGLTRWSPRMAGKRNWFIARRELLRAAHGKVTKGVPLSELLFIPETFSVGHGAEITQRQVNALSRLSASPNNRLLMIAEVRLIEQVRFGHRLLVKHMPDFTFMIADDLAKRLSKLFEEQLILWGNLEQTHLLLIGTISLSAQGNYCLESACLANVNASWMPFDNMKELHLLDELHRTERRFSKGLRYNLPSTKPLASVVLQDTGDTPTALYVVPVGASSDYENAAEKLNESAQMASWLWQADDQAMPALPERQLNSHDRPYPPSTSN